MKRLMGANCRIILLDYLKNLTWGILLIVCTILCHQAEAQNRSLQEQAEKTDLTNTKIKYQFRGEGTSFTISPNWENATPHLRMLHSDEKEMLSYDEYFNRAVKRWPVILVTGDKPRFALMYSDVADQMDPALVKMGDGRIRITIGNKSVWLDEFAEIKTIFNPSSTEYICSSPQFSQLSVDLLISQASDWGSVVKISLNNHSVAPLKLKTELIYGGLRKCGRVFSASYFSPNDKEELDSNHCDIRNNFVKLTDKNIQGEVAIFTKSPIKPFWEDNHISIRNQPTIVSHAKSSFYFIVSLTLNKNDSFTKNIENIDPESVILESSNYYKKILDQYKISTPSLLLNNGYKTALLNFDNIYSKPAWLEGINWWSAYWTNNFQISAAIALQQNDRARAALSVYNSSEYGPAPVLTALGHADIQSKSGEDGLPYYIYNLIRYYNSTGDSGLLSQVWPGLRKSVEDLWRNRDPDGNGLLNWHLGANAFMYQADHLEMPGDAASPSLMMAGMLDQLSEIAGKIGRRQDANIWKPLSEKIYKSLDSVLWNKRAGAFYNHRDEQGLLHSVNYYTDLIFPTLYTSLPQVYGWQSLAYLYRTLWTYNYKGEKNLMSVGGFKPSIFGNDNVMPVQMAEAARAYFKQGDNEKAVRLMESVALAGTIFTEAPGNFPERLNDEGKGEANYLFGNPIASFIYSMVNGLFGLELRDQGKLLYCEPAFPEKWNFSDIQLPCAKFSYKRINTGKQIRKTFLLTHSTARKMNFSIFIDPAEAIKIVCNGAPVKYDVEPALNKTRVFFSLQKADRHFITIAYTPLGVHMPDSNSVLPGGPLTQEISGGIEKVIDPQSALGSYSVSGTHLRAFAGNDTGWHTIFVKSKNLPVVFNLNFYIRDNNPVSKRNELIRLREFSNEQTLPLDISAFYNTDKIFLSSRWRYEYALRDSTYLSSVGDSAKNLFSAFHYKVKSPFTMLMINNGISDAYSTVTNKNGMPSQFEIPVKQKLQALSFLWMAEMQSRNTGMEVGYVRLNYTNGDVKNIPLIAGKNLDASWGYFARETEPVLLKGEDYAKTYTLRCDPSRELRSFTIHIIASDIQIGLMAVNMIFPSKERNKLPVVGAIRWDGWFHDTSNFVTRIVEKTLAPAEFHNRLPFFAKELGKDSVSIDGSGEEVMNKEIAYASAAGLDYWAFVLYSPDEELSGSLRDYLKNARRRDINFSIITEEARITPSNAVYLNYIRRLFQEPGFQKVENGRPLWFLGFVDSVNVKKNWGSFKNMKNTLDSIRAATMHAGFKNPYLVIMDFDPSFGKRWCDSLGADAISSYATSKNTKKGSYQQLTGEVSQFWDECKSTGASVIPICLAGWSPKPRMDYQNTWTHFYPKDVYYSNATPIELANHLRSGLSWLQNNRVASPAQCVLIYAWNEFDEGGWICPTLYNGTDRLDALSKAILEFKR